MKKYLMTGIAAVALCAAFTSCSHEEGFSTLEEAKTAQYEAAFIEAFGKPAANQDWGFGITSRTRTADTNGNEWGYTYKNVPDPLTADQLRVVREWFQANENPQGVSIDYSDFFVQHVYVGGTNVGSNSTEHYTCANGDDIVGGEKMNKLVCGPVLQSNGSMGPDHINNGNASNISVNYNVTDGRHYKDGWVRESGENEQPTLEDYHNMKQHSDQIQHMVNSSTKYFGYENSLQNSNLYNDRFVIIPGTEIDPSNTYGLHGKYFVGFDYDADVAHGYVSETNTNMYLKSTAAEGGRDYYYSDWIICVTPGLKWGDYTDEIKYSGRIFCEDLGSIGDFDFNDVVFDAYIYQSGKIEIDIFAAGGRLPISVAGVAVDLGQMMNTGVNSTSRVQHISIPAETATANGWTTLKSIPIMVSQTTPANVVETYELSANVGQVPQKICVPLNTKWADEYIRLEKAYPDFKNYVSNPETNWTTTVVSRFVDYNLKNNGEQE